MFPEQVIVMSSSWTLAVQQFLDRFMRRDNRLGPIVAIDNFLEAAIYGKVDTRPQLLADKEAKLTALETILRNNVSSRACNFILIFCKDVSSAHCVQNFLRNKSGMEIEAISEDLDGLEINRRMAKIRAKEGMEVNPTPVILSDRAVVYLGPIHHCRTIVHFDLPDYSKGAFAHR